MFETCVREIIGAIPWIAIVEKWRISRRVSDVPPRKMGYSLNLLLMSPDLGGLMAFRHARGWRFGIITRGFFGR